MVRKTGPWLSWRLWPALFVVAIWPACATAAVVASLDRSNIELNESFTLKVTVDTAIDTEPDATALENDFDVVSRSQLSNTTIINGQISRSRTWTYILMARREGTLVVPPVVVGGEQSDPLTINVQPQRVAVPGQADIFVTSEVDYPQTWVQAQVLYRIKVYRAVATRQPRLAEPDISGVDVLVEVAADERSYDSLIDGKAYNVVERVYALFPQASGEISIAPAHFEARVLADGRITGRKVFQSDPVTIDVQPIPPPPADHPDAGWFPAKSVELAETWSRAPDKLPVGEPITRHVTVTALGQLSTQMPVIEPVRSDKVKVYPDKPELRDAPADGGVLATRNDQYAIIGVGAGKLELPAVELPWWNIDKKKWQVASLPATMIHVLPSPDAVPEEASAEQPPQAETQSSLQTTPSATNMLVVHSDFWRHVSEALVALWLLTLLLWWLARKPGRRAASRGAEPPPVYKQQAALLKKARHAAEQGDAAGCRADILEWAKLQWPDSPPRSIGDVARRLPQPLSDELMALNRTSYGPDQAAWDGVALARSLRSGRIAEKEARRRETPDLPPLMPSA